MRRALGLGNPVNTTEAAQLGRESQIATADQYVRELLPFLTAMRAGGITSIGAMTKALNQRRVRSVKEQACAFVPGLLLLMVGMALTG